MPRKKKPEAPEVPPPETARPPDGPPDLTLSVRAVEGVGTKAAAALVNFGCVNLGDLLGRAVAADRQFRRDPPRTRRASVYAAARSIPGLTAPECHALANHFPDTPEDAAVPMPKPPDGLDGPALAEIKAASDQVDAQARKVSDAERENERTKKALKGAEADHLEAVEDLQKTIQKWTGPVAPDLFHQKPDAAAAPDADAWRAEKLEVLIDLDGMTPALLVGLADEGLHTLGDLTDWLKGPPQKQYTDLPGFGAKKAEKLEAALAEFWKRQGYGGTVEERDPFEVDAEEAE